jgi:choline-sulfatase
MQAVREAGYRTSVFGKTHLHRHTGDLREREYLLHAYGLDDVDEIGGPRASSRLLSHMTARWQQLGLWEKYQEDYRERFANKPYVVRPSVLPLEEYADVYVGQQAKSYLERYDREKPWFCWVSFGGPHEPWDTPEPYAGMYKPDDMPDAIPESEDRGGKPTGYLQFKLGRSPKPSQEEVRKMRADYAGNVSLIDDQIGDILKTIEKRGELDNTVIVFSSDHGEMNGDHGLIYKETFLNSAVRVPLLIRTPETFKSSAAGSVCNSPAEWFDIGPTITDLAGGAMEHQQFAKSLCPVLEDPETLHRDFAVSEIHGEIMYMDNHWKMALNASGVPYLLFDLKNDPDEINNLVDMTEYSGKQTELRLKLQEHLVQNQVRLTND